MKKRLRAIALTTLLCAGCQEDLPQALGTLEYDRITLPAPAAERIVSIDVREGQRVLAGGRVLTLERARSEAEVQSARAQVRRQREVLSELEAGPRSEDIEQARASLAGLQAQARDSRAQANRFAVLGRKRLVAAAEIDRARAAAASADAEVRGAQAALARLQAGTRVEQIAQARAALEAAEAQFSAQDIALDKLELLAPRAGLIDSLPYKLGDQAPVGAPLAVLLVGDAPYARIYVPETLRAGVKVGDRAQVWVGGRAQAYQGRVRAIRSEPSFTPYYALIGDDAARLSYLAEVELDKSAAALPAGLPVRVEFANSP